VVAAGLPLESPLVGRQNELDLLRKAFEHAVRTRTCQLVSVVAPAGVGKARLALELGREVSDGALVLHTFPAEAKGIPFWPLAELMRRIPGTPRLVSEHLAEGRTEERFSAARTLFDALGAERPLVVVCGELHTAEPTWLDLLEHVARRSRGVPILLVCLARPKLHDRRRAWPAEAENVKTIVLGPLSESECDELAERLGAPPELVDAVRASTRGNPLHIEQLVALSGEGPGSVLTLEEAIDARVKRLPDSQRSLLEAAAVEGLIFHRRTVETLAGGDLAPLVEARLVRPWPEGTGADAELRFGHPLIRDVVLAALPDRRRAALLERLAAMLESAVETPAEEREALLGHYVEQARRFRIASGLDDRHAAALGRRAARRLADAGMRAFQRVDRTGDAAPELLGRAVNLLPAADPLRRELLPVLVAAQADAAGVDRAAQTIAEGRAIAEAAGDRRLAARLRVEDAWLRFHVDPSTDLADVLGDLEKAIAVLEELGDDAAVSRALYAHGSVVFSLGRAEASLGPLERAVLTAGLAADRRAEVDAVWQLTGPIFWGPMPVDEGRRRVHELRVKLPPRSQPDAFAVMLDAIFAAMLGRFDEARARSTEANAMFDALGIVGADVGLPQYTCRLQLLAGDVDGAVAELQAACDAYEQRNETGYLSSTAAQLAEALYRQGRADEALAATETSERTAAADDFSAQMLWRSVRAKALARRDDHARAKQLAREAVEIGEPSDYLFMRADSLLDLAEVLRAAGETDEAVTAARSASALYERKGELVSVTRAQELIAALDASSVTALT
jgi:tetratricopeptide (TPR) repeat protein